jgi:hypothetical protein
VFNVMKVSGTPGGARRPSTDTVGLGHLDSASSGISGASTMNQPSRPVPVSLHWSAVLRGQPERAARLFGAAAALRDASGVELPASEREDHDRDLTDVRARLDSVAFAAAWAAGRAMTLDEALAYVMQDLGTSPVGA